MCPGDGNLISVVGVGVGNLTPYGKKLPGNHAEARRLVERKLFLCNIVTNCVFNLHNQTLLTRLQLIV